MKLQSTYSKYKTLPNLRLHMLRVSSLALIVLNNWKGKRIDQDAILKTCLLHDIAKPISFDMEKQRLYAKNNKELENIRKCHDFLVNNYGNNEHDALNIIGNEIELDKTTLTLLANLDWNNINTLVQKEDINSLIPIYCDMRISPDGIVTIDERIENLKKRTGKENEQQYLDGNNLEKLISQNVSIDLNKITNDDINSKNDILNNIDI